MVRILRGGNIDLMGNYLLKNDDYYISSDYVKDELYLKENTLITPAVTSLEHVGKIARIDRNLNNTVVGGFVLMLKLYVPNNIVSEYFNLILSSQFHRSNCKEITRKSGQAFYNISREKLMNLPIPVPPLNEQKRIVEKLEQILPQIEQYGKYEEQLTKLNNELPEKLKKSILQQAIQGKIVPQNPEDEPATVLLEKIKQVKEQLIKDKKIKRNKNESTIYKKDGHWYEVIDKNNEVKCIDEEIPFEIPNSWCWTRLNTICNYIQRGKQPKYSENEKYPVISQKCIQWAGFDINKIRFIEEETVNTYQIERIIENKDLLWNSTGLGTLGRICIYQSDTNKYGWAVADSHVTVIRVFKKFINAEYCLYYFSNPTVQNIIESLAGGSTKQKELNLSTIKNYLIPIPSFNEQLRIVEKIKRLEAFQFF